VVLTDTISSLEMKKQCTWCIRPSDFTIVDGIEVVVVDTLHTAVTAAVELDDSAAQKFSQSVKELF